MKTLKLIPLLLLAIVLFSCQKEVQTEEFYLNLQIENKIIPEEFGYPCGGTEEFCSSYPIQIWAGAYVGTQREQMDANKGLFRQGPDGSFHTQEVEYRDFIHIQEMKELEPGAQVMITISCWDKEKSFWINSNDNIEVLINKDFVVEIHVSGDTGENPFADPKTLFGKWVNQSSCASETGEQSYYEFDNNDKGVKYYIDCANGCPLGQYLRFEYIDNHGTLDLIYLNASNFCSNMSSLPLPETITYQLSTHTLLIEGEEWTKQE